VYTEYVDSQRAAVAALRAAGCGAVLTMSGEDDDKTRAATTARFRQADDLILISTDSAAEGLNLQQRCHHLIHLELPFNPNRLEQRNGRIDRYGQTLEPQVRYLFLRGTFEERILLRLIAKYERIRARLTFVPNTLGITTETDAGQARLLQGLLEEDTPLFQPDETRFDLQSERENDGADPATAELLEEIDRSLQGFQRAAKVHAWLGDTGLNAEARLLQEANSTRLAGQQAEQVDLASFVCDAVQLDGGAFHGQLDDDCFTLSLPPAWTHGLVEMPGYEPESRQVRLTTRLDVTTDGEGRPVGFLGRAHPLVRQALERVRQLSFGGTARQGQDPRASAVRAAVAEPALLYTFLGRVISRGGRVLERVLAVQIERAGSPRYFATAADWLPLIDPDRALRTTDLWQRYFQDWAGDCASQAETVALDGFRPLAAQFSADHTRRLCQEVDQQTEWLRQRAEDITGHGASALPVQHPLFEPAPEVNATDWQSLTEPALRLAAFHADRRQPAAKRLEAESVLRIHRQRVEPLQALLELRRPDVAPLGVLMLIPEAGHGA